MSDGEVVHELLAGTSTSLRGAHHSYLKALVNEARQAILERFIGASVKELRGLKDYKATAMQ